MASLLISSSFDRVESYLQVGEAQIKTIEDYKPVRLSSYLSPSTSDEGLDEPPTLSASSESFIEKMTLPQSSWAIDTSRWDPKGQNLIEAVHREDTAQITLLLGCNSIFTSKKEAALTIAAEKGICAIISDLLKNDALENRWYYRMHLYSIGTSMIQAARQGHLEAVKQLVGYILQKPHKEPYYKLFNLLVNRALKENPSQEIVDVLTSWKGYLPLNDCHPAPPPEAKDEKLPDIVAVKSPNPVQCILQ